MKHIAIRISKKAEYAAALTTHLIKTWTCCLMFRLIEKEDRVFKKKRLITAIIIFPLWMTVALAIAVIGAAIAAYSDIFTTSNMYVKPKKPLNKLSVKEKAIIARYMTFGD